MNGNIYFKGIHKASFSNGAEEIYGKSAFSDDGGRNIHRMKAYSASVNSGKMWCS